MDTFFIAFPSCGASYLFGMYSNPDGRTLPVQALAPFRELNPAAMTRLLIADPSYSADVLTSVTDLLTRRMSRADASLKRRFLGPAALLHEVSGETAAGVYAMGALVRAVALGETVSGELGPLREASAPLKFYFAHAGETAARRIMGTCADPTDMVRGFRTRQSGQAVTVYTGETARAGELFAAVSAVLDDPAAADDLVREFLLPLFTAILGRGEGGLNVRVFPASRPNPPS